MKNQNPVDIFKEDFLELDLDLIKKDDRWQKYYRILGNALTLFLGLEVYFQPGQVLMERKYNQGLMMLRRMAQSTQGQNIFADERFR